jgi:hypothetical protein
MGVLLTLSLGWPGTRIFFISASQVAGIIGMSHNAQPHNISLKAEKNLIFSKTKKFMRRVVMFYIFASLFNDWLNRRQKVFKPASIFTLLGYLALIETLHPDVKL